MRKGKIVGDLLRRIPIVQVAEKAFKMGITTGDSVMKSAIKGQLSRVRTKAGKAALMQTIGKNLGGRSYKMPSGGTRYRMPRNLSEVTNKSAAKKYNSIAFGKRQSAKEVLSGYLKPEVSNPALKGMGKGLETIDSSKIGMAKLRRWGGIGAGAWTGANFLRRGDQIGPF